MRYIEPRALKILHAFLNTGNPDAATKQDLVALDAAMEAKYDASFGNEPRHVRSRLVLYAEFSGKPNRPRAVNYARRFEAATVDLSP